MSDPRRRKARHTLTPENLSSAIQVTNLPADWTQDTVSSVVAGSGPIIDISTKNDPRTGKLSSVLFDFKTSRDCKRAFDNLSRITGLPCSLERIIPQNYEEHASGKSELTLNRDSFPWNLNLDLPFEMVSEVPLPRKPVTTTASSSSSSVANNGAKVAFPDILSKASQHLPQFQPNTLTAGDPVSKNLSKTPPLQLIEIVSNLKILANQDSSRRNQLESFLKTNMDISVSVTQALLEMGFIDYNAVTNVIKTQNKGNGIMSSNSGSTSAVNSNSNTPLNQNMAPLNNMPMPMPMPRAPPFMPQQAQMQQQPPPPFGFVPPPMPFMPPTPTMHSPPPMMSPQPGAINMVKLQALPQNQRDMIKQVLKLTDDQLRSLPADQRTMVQNLRKEYTV